MTAPPENPTAVTYGLFVNGKVKDGEFKTLAAAHQAAIQLRFGGNEVTIYDKLSRKPVQ